MNLTRVVYRFTTWRWMCSMVVSTPISLLKQPITISKPSRIKKNSLNFWNVTFF